MRLARAAEAVAGRPVAGPHSGSTELPRAARRALRRPRGRAGALRRRGLYDYAVQAAGTMKGSAMRLSAEARWAGSWLGLGTRAGDWGWGLGLGARAKVGFGVGVGVRVGVGLGLGLGLGLGVGLA